jgi:Ran GTPase-activating protein (RanGAP) involved in mRNA processing and transport
MHAGLSSLDLSSNSINVEGSRTLSPSLTHLHMLRTVDVSYNRVSAGGIGALVEALATLRHLAVVKLGSNHIGPEGAVELAKYLSRMTGSFSLRPRFYCPCKFAGNSVRRYITLLLESRVTALTRS